MGKGNGKNGGRDKRNAVILEKRAIRKQPGAFEV